MNSKDLKVDSDYETKQDQQADEVENDPEIAEEPECERKQLS